MAAPVPPASLSVVEIAGDELVALPTSVHDWRGDWRVDGLGAGHVRVGAVRSPPQLARTSPCAVLLVDLDLVAPHDAEQLEDPCFVVASGAFAGAMAELPASLVVQHAHTTWRRGDARRQPERRFFAAAVDLLALRAFADGADVSFYARVQTPHGRRFVNRDGVAGQDFVFPLADLVRWSG